MNSCNLSTENLPPNVLLQAKNGPVDFQPREPFQPLFGAMPQDPGHPGISDHAGVSGFFKSSGVSGSNVARVFDSDTYAKGPGSTVTKVVDGSLYHQRITGIAGVAQHGIGSQLDRSSSGAGKLVCIRAPGMESGCVFATDCRRMDRDDVHPRSVAQPERSPG